jgi:hypothetical protein
MATFKRATVHSNSGKSIEILINVDQVRYMRANQDGSVTTVHFDGDQSVAINEPPDAIAMLATVE